MVTKPWRSRSATGRTSSCSTGGCPGRAASPLPDLRAQAELADVADRDDHRARRRARPHAGAPRRSRRLPRQGCRSRRARASRSAGCWASTARPSSRRPTGFAYAAYGNACGSSFTNCRIEGDTLLRIKPVLCAVTAMAAAGAVGGVAATGSPAQGDEARTYVVLLAPSTSTEQATQSIEAAGGSVEKLNTAVGVATVRSTNGDFAADAKGQAGIQGAAADRSIGRVPAESRTHRERVQIERLQALRDAGRGKGAQAPLSGYTSPGDPLAPLQWDMQMIHATHGRLLRQASRARKDVRVGIIDTGVDASHPDIAPNFDRALRRNFTVDDPVIDGAVRRPTRTAPARTRPTSTRTATARTSPARSARRSTASGSPASRRGSTSSTCAPARTRATSSCSRPSTRSPTPATTASTSSTCRFYIDPWLYNCTANPADTPERAGRAAHDHRGHAARAGLRPRPRRDAGRRRGNEAHRPRPPGLRRHEPGLPAGRRARPQRSTTRA